MRFPTLAIRTHLLLFGFALLIPLLVAGIFVATSLEQAERENLYQRARVVSQETAVAIERDLNAYKIAVEALATSRMLAAGNFERFYSRAKSMQKSLPGVVITVRRADGQHVVNTLVPWGASLPRTSASELLRTDNAALGTDQIIISGVYSGATAKTPYVALVRQVPVNGEPHLITLAVPADRIREIVDSRLQPRGWLSAVVDRNHVIVARSQDHSAYVGTTVTNEMREKATGEFGSFTGLRRDGVPVFVAYRRVPSSGWVVVSAIPLAQIEEPLRFLWIFIFSLFAAGLALSVGLAALHAHYLLAGFKQLDHAATVADGAACIEPPRTGILQLDKVGSTLTQAARDLHSSLTQRAKLHRRLIDAEEQERARLSRDLHDQTGQSIAAALLTIRRLENRGEGVAACELRPLHTELDRIGETLHRVAWELRPPLIDELGLAEALKSYISQWSSKCGITADFHCCNLVVDDVSHDIQTAIYRVTQEALTNIAKHADGATIVSVVLSRDGPMLRLMVGDNGCGFDPRQDLTNGEKHAGLGLAGIRERLSLLGGDFDLESAPGSGTTVFARIPLVSQALTAA